MRPFGAHVAQRRVGQHHIGRHVLFLGDLRAQLPERLKQRLGLGGDLRFPLRRARGAALFRRFALHRRQRIVLHAHAAVDQRPRVRAELQNRILVAYALQKALFHHAVDQLGNGRTLILRKRAIAVQPIEPVLQQALLPAAREHGGDDAGSEALAAFRHALHDVQRHGRHVDLRRRTGAVAASVALARGLFAEIAQDVRPQAAVGSAIALHGDQPRARLLPELRRILRAEVRFLAHVVDEEALRDHILRAVQKHAVGALAVAPRAPGLLIVAFNVLGHVVVNHKPHVRLVDAHAEGVRGHHNAAVIHGERVLIAAALVVGQSRVVVRGAEAVALQAVADFLHLPARGAIDDAAHAAIAVQKFGQRLALVRGTQYAVIQVRPVEAGDQLKRLPKADQAANVRAHALRRRGRERAQPRPRRKTADELLNIQIRRPEILPPLGDAMRLVHGDHARVHFRRQRKEALRQKPLRRDVDNLILAAARVGQRRRCLPLGERAVQKRRGHARLRERVHLILHQRNQRGNHDGAALHGQRGNLVAQALARAGGHHAQHVPAVQNGPNHVLLPLAERAVAVYAFENRVNVARHARLPNLARVARRGKGSLFRILKRRLRKQRVDHRAALAVRLKRRIRVRQSRRRVAFPAVRREPLRRAAASAARPGYARRAILPIIRLRCGECAAIPFVHLERLRRAAASSVLRERPRRVSVLSALWE